MTTPKRIAVLTRARFSYHLQLGWGFLEAMNQCLDDVDSWMPIMFMCREVLPEVMHEQMKEATSGKYDLIVSFGALWTDVAAKFIRENSIKTPLVFGGVTDPVALGVLPELRSTNQITGIYRTPASWTEVAEMLHYIKPSMKRILIPFREHAENGLIKKALEEVRDRYAEAGVECILFPVTKFRICPEEIYTLLLSVDTLWSFEGGFLDIFSSSMIEICNMRHITFFSNNAAHIAQGAALVYAAPDFSVMGEALLKQMYQILEEGKKPEEVDIIKLPDDRRMMVNLEAAKLQGLDLDKVLLMAMRNGLMIIK